MAKEKKEKTFFERMNIDFRKSIIGSIILTVLFLIFGVIIYMNPYYTSQVIGIILGIFLIVFGIYAIFEFFASRLPIFTSKVFTGIISIILGIFAMTNPFKINRILTFTFGIYLIIVSIYKIVCSIKLRKYSYDGWGVMMAMSILILIFGVLITVNPMASMDIIKLSGIFIILFCILEICNLIMVFSKSKDIEKKLKEGIK